METAEVKIPAGRPIRLMHLFSRIPRISMWMRVGVLIALAGLPFTESHAQSRAASRSEATADEEQLEQYLDRIGLVRYQMLQLERLLEGADREQSGKYARRLADLYAAQLLALSEDENRYSEMIDRIEQLVARHPQANTPALEVMLLQADFQRAEALMARWMTDRELAARQEASTLLGRIAPRLIQHHKKLREDAEQQEIALDRLTDSSQLNVMQRELARTQELAARAAFLGGWSHYYLGLTESNTASFQTARNRFRELLGLDEDYSDLEADWIGLESTGRARALIGLGLAEAALDNLDASRACFELLEHSSVAPAIRDQAQQWYVQGLLNGGNVREAVDYARGVVDSFMGRATPGKVSLCVVLAREGFRPEETEMLPAASPADIKKLRKQLGLLGLKGLARLGEITVLGELIEKYDISFEQDENDFFVLWIGGQQALGQARKSRKPEDFAAAVKAFQAALAAPNAQADVRSISQCRIQLAWCQFQQGNFPQAAEQYAQAAGGQQALSDSEGAVRNLWNAFVAYEKASREESRWTNSALEILKRIQENFPDHEYAAKARYQASRLQRKSGTPAEAIRRLQAISPDDPNYLAARVDLYKLLHEQWSAAEGALEKQRLGEQLRAAVDTYLAAVERQSPRAAAVKAEPRVTALVLAADTLLRGPANDGPAADRYLNRAKPLASQLSADSTALREYHYRQLLSARLSKNQSEVAEHARWLAEYAAGLPYELIALVLSAQALEKQIEQRPADQRRELWQEARQIYQRLVVLLGDAPEVLSRNRNAQVACSRLAECYAELGDPDQAARQLDRLLEAFPKEKSYLRRAAIAHYQTGNYATALNHWRTLLRGLPGDSPDWFEAKYYQVSCLSRTEPSKAKQVFQQFRLLHPDLGPAPWRKKFEDWAREMDGD